METEKGSVLEWRIENLSHWCPKVHSHCIESPNFIYPCFIMELHPKGIGGQGEHLVVRLCDIKRSISSELSFHSPDGSLLCSKQQVNSEMDTDLELPPGPKFEDVLSRIRESEDFITVKLREHDGHYCVNGVCTTVNVFKISVKMSPRWVKTMLKSGETKNVCSILFPPGDYFVAIMLSTCFKNDMVHFMIDPTDEIEYPFAVEMCMSLTGSDDNAVKCLKNEHVFLEKGPWTLPDSLEKKELFGKGISMCLWVKTKNVIQSIFYRNLDYRYFSIELNNCLSTKGPSTDPLTCNTLEVFTNDSFSSLPSTTPDDSVLVLSKDLMCLYQDQDFSDISLKCDNVTFTVHRAILSARSPVFKTMLSTDMAEAASGEVDIGDLDPSTLSLFLTYLYTGRAVEEDLLSERAIKLYYAADKYQVPSLKKDCSKFLCANVSISNVCDILSVGDKHLDDQLTSLAHDFLLNNYNDVLKSNEWESFMCREPLLAVKTVTHFASKDRVKMHDPK